MSSHSIIAQLVEMSVTVNNSPIKDYVLLAPVVQTLDSAIQWINIYPVDSAIGFPNTYPLDSDLSDG